MNERLISFVEQGCSIYAIMRELQLARTTVLAQVANLRLAGRIKDMTEDDDVTKFRFRNPRPITLPLVRGLEQNPRYKYKRVVPEVEGEVDDAEAA